MAEIETKPVYGQETRAMNKAVAKAKPQEPQAPKLTKVRTVYGLMVHPFTSQVFDGEAETTIDSWVNSQIEAGKMQLC